MIRAVRKKVEASAHHLKEEIVLALFSFREDESNDVEGHDDGEQEDWTATINRGGLYQIKTEFFNFLGAMELAVKRHYRMGQCKIASRPEVEKNVKDDEEVQFWWDTLCAILDIEDETSQALLEVLVSFYVPFRGFAFTSRWMEKYKQQSRKSIQKSRSLRNKLQQPTN